MFRQDINFIIHNETFRNDYNNKLNCLKNTQQQNNEYMLPMNIGKVKLQMKQHRKKQSDKPIYCRLYSVLTNDGYILICGKENWIKKQLHYYRSIINNNYIYNHRVNNILKIKQTLRKVVRLLGNENEKKISMYHSIINLRKDKIFNETFLICLLDRIINYK